MTELSHLQTSFNELPQSPQLPRRWNAQRAPVTDTVNQHCRLIAIQHYNKSFIEIKYRTFIYSNTLPLLYVSGNICAQLKIYQLMPQ